MKCGLTRKIVSVLQDLLSDTSDTTFEDCAKLNGFKNTQEMLWEMEKKINEVIVECLEVDYE